MYDWKEFTPDEQRILIASIPSRFIVVSLDMIDILDGDMNAAVVLQSLLQWSSSSADKQGWFFHTHGQITNETHISLTTQKRIRTKLVEMGILEQERRGVPSKNYYRINLAEVLRRIRELPIKSDASSPSKSARNRPTGGAETGQDNQIRESNKESNNSITVGSVPSRRNARINVLDSGMYRTGKDSDWYVDQVYDFYPATQAGVRPSREIVTRQVAKMASLPYNASDEKQAEACRLLKDFGLAVVHYANAVKQGYVKPEYVMSFESFSGINRRHDYVPKYKEWIYWKPPVQKRELVAI